MLLNSPKKAQLTELENETLQLAVLQHKKDVETIKGRIFTATLGVTFLL